MIVPQYTSPLVAYDKENKKFVEVTISGSVVGAASTSGTALVLQPGRALLWYEKLGASPTKVTATETLLSVHVIKDTYFVKTLSNRVMKWNPSSKALADVSSLSNS